MQPHELFSTSQLFDYAQSSTNICSSLGLSLISLAFRRLLSEGEFLLGFSLIPRSVFVRIEEEQWLRNLGL
uniref:Uncharacterized protein n=1 Tax=Cucumis melo TaxID=3656 RepID=A0A9I9EBC5_CUCME